MSTRAIKSIRPEKGISELLYFCTFAHFSVLPVAFACVFCLDHNDSNNLDNMISDLIAFQYLGGSHISHCFMYLVSFYYLQYFG